MSSVNLSQGIVGQSKAPSATPPDSAFRLSREIDVVATLAVVVSVVLAVVVQRWLEQRRYADTLLKDAAVRRVHEAIKRIDLLRDLLEQDTADFAAIVRRVRNLGLACEQLLQALPAFGVSLSLSQTEATARLRALRAELRTLLTDTPLGPDPADATTVTQGVIRYGAERLAKARATLEEWGGFLLDVEVDVLRSTIASGSFRSSQGKPRT